MQIQIRDRVNPVRVPDENDTKSDIVLFVHRTVIIADLRWIFDTFFPYLHLQCNYNSVIFPIYIARHLRMRRNNCQCCWVRMLSFKILCRRKFSSKSSLPFYIKRVGQPDDEYKVFRVATWFKHKEILPVMAIMGAVAIALPAFGVYWCQTRPDLNFTRQRKIIPEEKYDVAHPTIRKMLSINQTCEPNQELIAALEYRKEYKRE